MVFARIIAVHAADCNRSDGHNLEKHSGSSTHSRMHRLPPPMTNTDGNLYADRNTTFLLRLLRFRPYGLRRFFRLWGLFLIKCAPSSVYLRFYLP